MILARLRSFHANIFSDHLYCTCKQAAHIGSHSWFDIVGGRQVRTTSPAKATFPIVSRNLRNS